VIEGVLGHLIPDPEDSEQIGAVLDNLAAKRNPFSLFDQLREFLCFGIWEMESPNDNTSGLITEESLIQYIIHDLAWVEVLTHVFDFLYFYQQDEEEYIRSAWVSWSVVPNIQDRIPEYILRCLCALHAKNLRRVGPGAEITIERLLSCLKNASAAFPSASIISKAIVNLEEYRAEYLDKLCNCEDLIKFVRYFLYSPLVERMFIYEPMAEAGGKESFGLTMKEFSGVKVVNPLRFIKEFSGDTQGDMVKSAWVLTRLAFLGVR
jgi:hypothetical protein